MNKLIKKLLSWWHTRRALHHNTQMLKYSEKWRCHLVAFHAAMALHHLPKIKNLHDELVAWLDTQKINGDNIGSIRSRCFMPWDSEWNSLVRDETARREQPTPKHEEKPIAANPEQRETTCPLCGKIFWTRSMRLLPCIECSQKESKKKSEKPALKVADIYGICISCECHTFLRGNNDIPICQKCYDYP